MVPRQAVSARTNQSGSLPRALGRSMRMNRTGICGVSPSQGEIKIVKESQAVMVENRQIMDGHQQFCEVCKKRSK